MDNLCDCFKIAAVIMLFCFAALHLPDFKRKMLPQNFIEPIHKISYHLTEQIVLVLKEKIQCPCGHTRLLADSSEGCPRKPFLHKFFFGTLDQVYLRLAVMYFLSCHGTLPVNKNVT